MRRFWEGGKVRAEITVLAIGGSVVREVTPFFVCLDDVCLEGV